MTRLEVIKARCEAATPGEWIVSKYNVTAYHESLEDGYRIIVRDPDDEGPTHEDKEFIAAAHNLDIPALVRLIEALLAEREAMRDLPAMAMGMVVGWSPGAKEAMAHGPEELSRFVEREYSCIPKARAMQDAATEALREFEEAREG